MSEIVRAYWPDDEREYDEKLERLVDSGRFSYDDARRILGSPPYEIEEGDRRENLRGSMLVRAVLRGLITFEDLI